MRSNEEIGMPVSGGLETSAAPAKLGRARRSDKPESQWEQPPLSHLPDNEPQDPRPGAAVQQTATAILESRTVNERQRLEREIAVFVARMHQQGFPGINLIDVVDGHKKGIRYWLTPEYRKEIVLEQTGWKLYVADCEDLMSDPPWRKLHYVCLFGLTVDGCIVLERMDYRFSFKRLHDITELKELSKMRYYVAQLEKRWPAISSP